MIKEDEMAELKDTNRPSLLTMSEAAQLLRISKWTIYQLMHSGELKTLTIATRRFVATDDLETFVNERKGLVK